MNLPARVYDLSQPVFSNCPQYPDTTPRPVQVRLFYMLAVNGVNKEIVEMSTHSGTHCDAPYHFFADGATIDEIPLETYVAPAAILDFRHKEPGMSVSAGAEIPKRSSRNTSISPARLRSCSLIGA